MKTILVVGASKGIGQQIAQKLTEQGNRVIGISRNPAQNVALHFSVDVLSGTLPVIDEMIDGIVYCPGSITLKPFRGLKPFDFVKDFEINTLGAIKVLQQYLPNLQKSPSAAVVLFSTCAVQTGLAFHASIAAAKGAVEGLTRSLAAEWAPKIRVNCIAPSLTDTPLAAHLLDSDAKKQASADRHPLKRVGRSTEIAAMACLLLGSDGAFITGQIIKIDGGISAIKG